MDWRNDPVAVSFSVTGQAVGLEEHHRWLMERLNDAQSLLWIAEDRGEAVGQVRVDMEGGIGTVSIAVAPDHRGRGLATEILRAMLVEMAHTATVGELRATVHTANTASLRAFERVGFRTTGDRERGFVILGMQIRTPR
jgi:RimJ/RimL family protein N-acetyltransferase